MATSTTLRATRFQRSAYFNAARMMVWTYRTLLAVVPGEWCRAIRRILLAPVECGHGVPLGDSVGELLPRHSFGAQLGDHPTIAGSCTRLGG